MNELINLEADIIVHHIHNPGHGEPFCHIAEIHPPGTLPLTVQAKTAA